MKLSETHHETMQNMLERCNVTSQKFHTLDDGTITAIEITYVPNDFNKAITALPYNKR